MKEHHNTKKPATNTTKNTQSTSQSHNQINLNRLSNANILSLQRMLGNQATQQMIQRGVIQGPATAPPAEHHPLYEGLEARMKDKVNPDEINAAVWEVIRWLDIEANIQLNEVQRDGLYAVAPDPKKMAEIAFVNGK